MASRSGINGRPVAISPRMMSYQLEEQTNASGGGFLSSIMCGGADSSFLMCDAGPRNNEVDFDVNPTGVYVAVHTKQWSLAIERAKIYPKEVSTWVNRYGTAEADEQGANAPGVPFSRSGERADGMAATLSPRSGSANMPVVPPSAKRNGPKVLRWRMLPIHAAILFGAPLNVVEALMNMYKAGLSAHDDQGMLPLHLAFRVGASEEMILKLIDAYPEAIERADFKGRLPSMLGPKTAMSYGDLIGEAFIKGPSYYYWASRVATADRVRSESLMAKKINELEESVRVNDEQGKALLDKKERQLIEELEAFAAENHELKERLVWYETKYEGAEEKEKVLVDHTNSLAERLRLTSLSEEHLATKLAKLETRLQSKESELSQARAAAKDRERALTTHLNEVEKTLKKTEHKVESLSENLEKKIVDSNEMKVRFEKERQLFEKQIDASKECLMELIASSKEDKKMFEEDSKEMRKQVQSLQAELHKATLDERRRYEEDSQELRRQLMAVQSEVRRAAVANKANTVAPVIPQALEDQLINLQKHVAMAHENTHSAMSHVNNVDEKHISGTQQSKENRERLESLEEEVMGARANIGRNDVPKISVDPESDVRDVPYSPSSSSMLSRVSRVDSELAERSVHSTKKTPGAMALPQPENDIMAMEEGDELFDTYISTKSVAGAQSRDDTECFSHASDVGTALALGDLSEEQRIALEQLDLSGSREELAAMLGRVPGLTKNQVNLLVDVASSLAV